MKNYILYNEEGKKIYILPSSFFSSFLLQKSREGNINSLSPCLKGGGGWGGGEHLTHLRLHFFHIGRGR